MKPRHTVGLVTMAALSLGGCSLFDSKPDQPVAAQPDAAPKVAMVEPEITGPIIPGGPPMPQRKPTATAGATIAVPPKSTIAAAVPAAAAKAPDAPAATTATPAAAVVVPPRPAAPSTDINADKLAPTICRHTDELMADEVRRLQTTLLVATLRCQKAPDLKDAITSNYNQYVKTFGSEMLRHTQVLQGLFKRQYGGSSVQRFDLYVTAMANEFSQDSMADPLTYCQNALTMLQDLNKLQSKDIGTYSHGAQNVVKSAVAKGC